MGEEEQRMQPFDYHRARPVELEDRARELLRLADEAADQEAVTQHSYDAATAAWDGVAAAELRAAPEPVRRQAESVASQLGWAALPLRYWADQVRRFNNQVDTLLLHLAGVPAEVERRLRVMYGEFNAELQDPAHEFERERIRYQLIGDLRRQWEQAWDTHLHDGARTAAGMLSHGPTFDNLRLVRELALMPTGGLVDYLAVGWDRTAAVQEAQRIAALLLDPSAPLPTEQELERLAALLEQYEGDEEFAYFLLTGLGPQGLLELTAQVAILTTAGGGADLGVLVETIDAIQTGLAAALATATVRRGTQHEGGPYSPAEFELPPAWVDELTALGRQRLSGGLGTTAGVEFYGYQALGVLLGAAGYDSHFLTVVGADMIDFEIEQGGSDIWANTRRTDVRLNWTDHLISSSTGFDPMVGLMKALMANPEATKELLTNSIDPEDPMKLTRLDYLLIDRQWPIDTVPGPDRSNEANPGIDYFGTALESAVTIDADERSYRIVEAIIYAVGTEAAPDSKDGEAQDKKIEPFPARDLVHEELRRHLGRIAAHYIEDLHWLAVDESGSPKNLTAGEMKLAKIDSQHLRYFFAEVGKDLSARDEIFAASLVYADQLSRIYLDGWYGSDTGAAEKVRLNVARPLGLMLGALDIGAEEAMRRGYAEADEAHNRAVAGRLFWLRLGTGAASDPIPGGSAVSFFAGTVLDHLEEQWRHDSTGLANYYVGEHKNITADAIKDMMDAVVYDTLTSQMTPEEFLSQIPSGDLGIAEDLFYSEDHPLAGTLIPAVEWGDKQWDAWERCQSHIDADFINKLQHDADDAYSVIGTTKARETMGLG